MKKKKFLLLSIVVIALLALVAVGTVLGQEPEEPEELPPLPNATPEVPVDEEEQAGVLPAAAVDAAFTYQGRLTDSGGSPVSDGVYDFEVQFWNGPDPSTAAQVGITIAATDTVSSGLFELTLPVTYGSFNGQELYLRMRVSADGGTTWDDWTNTQPILPVPYALSLRPGAIIGGTGAGHGRLLLRDSVNRQTYELNGGNGYFTLGASGVDGDLDIRDSGGQIALLLDGDTARLTLGDSTGGNPGDLIIRDNNGDDTIWLDGQNGYILGGLEETHGDLEIRTNDELSIYLDANNDSGSSFSIYNHTDATSERVFRVEDDGDVRADGGYYCGRSYDGTGFGGALLEDDLEAGPCLQDDSQADFAEMLPAQEELELGDVLVVAPDGTLARSSESHQPTVVGVYSTRPSYVGSARLLGQPGYAPLAIVGIVPVKASAENGSIQPGDLLVASATPGHAMKADPNPPVGTVIGKALGALEKGTGIIELLVMLQ